MGYGTSRFEIRYAAGMGPNIEDDRAIVDAAMFGTVGEFVDFYDSFATDAAVVRRVRADAILEIIMVGTPS